MATILIVDDRPTNRELLVTLLGYAGHRLLEAAEGEEGLAIARAERPDLIITDIVMPTMDGYEFARQVRADLNIGETQIIFYTSSYIVAETRQLAEACGVSIVISKPIEPQALLDTVQVALESRQRPVIPPDSEDFHREHMRLLTDTLVKKVDELEAEIAERKRAQEQTQLQIQRLKSLHAIDVAISSSFNLNLTLDILLKQVITQLNVDATLILLFQPVTRTLIYAAGRGFRTTAIREVKVRFGEGYAGKALLERRTIHIPNLMEAEVEFVPAALLKDEAFIDYYCVPLLVKGEVKGVLEIFHRSVLARDPEWLDFLETLAGQAAIAIEDSTLFENLQRSNQELFQAYDATIEGWSHALDLRDKETEGHTQRVTELTMQLARKFGFTEEQLINIRWGALLHDIGKMGVPDTILLKPGKLTDEEWEIMRKHPTFALEMLSPIAYLKSSIDIPYCHHEKWDGSGYPRGLKGEVIPLAARLFAVVDVWDALRSDRPYRKRWTVEKTIEHIRSQTGTHFDPKVVKHFLSMMEGSID
ncbi:MAG TPA: HD domain-containing phosphohydrolase [Anaerolineales bacterium]|nr:HD domain-containing phosphohydrolase [Anaerolineales bacterium]